MDWVLRIKNTKVDRTYLDYTRQLVLEKNIGFDLSVRNY